MAYQGWANYETWNVSLWINNDEGLYNLARECKDYKDFQEQMREMGITETPDKVAYNDSSLDTEALDEVVWGTRGIEDEEEIEEEREEQAYRQSREQMERFRQTRPMF